MLARTNLATAQTTNCPKTHDAAIMAFTAAALIGLTAILGTVESDRQSIRIRCLRSSPALDQNGHCGGPRWRPPPF